MKKKHVFLYFAMPMILYWCGTFAIQSVIAYIIGIENLSNYGMIVSIFSSLILVPFAILMYEKDKKGQSVWWSEKKDITQKWWRHLLIVTLGIGCCIFLNSLIILSNLQGKSEEYQNVSQMIYQTQILIRILGVGVIAPVLEEVLYRGCLYPRLREYLGITISVFGSAMAFGINHGNMIQFLYAFVVGIVLAIIMEKYHNLNMCIIFHIVINITSVIATELQLFSRISENNIFMIVAIGLSAITCILSFVFLKTIDKVQK